MTIREHNISLPLERLVQLCREKYIRKIGLFGSALREDFSPQSDVDLLVEFHSGRVPGLITLMSIQNSLARLIGRPVDLRASEEFAPETRTRLEKEAEVLFEE